MIILVFSILFLILYQSKFKMNEGFFEDYLCKDKTLAIKGIFVIFVFYRHCSNYISLTSFLDYPMIILNRILGQSIVALFLFYSGYGIYEQIKVNKGEYVKNFYKRFLSTYINFFMAVVSFLILDIILNTLDKYSLKTILLSFIGWESIGNSNWYMFLTFVLYIFVILSFTLRKDNKSSLLCMTIFTLIYGLVIIIFKDQWWMNTALCFPLGMIYSYNKEKIEKYMQGNKRYLLVLFALILPWVILNIIYIIEDNFIIYSIISCLFTLIIVFVTMKFSITNKVLMWLGKMCFWMYILQRIPMIILENTAIVNYSYLYFVLCFVITCLLSIIYMYMSRKINTLFKLK